MTQPSASQIRRWLPKLSPLLGINADRLARLQWNCRSGPRASTDAHLPLHPPTASHKAAQPVPCCPFRWTPGPEEPARAPRPHPVGKSRGTSHLPSEDSVVARVSSRRTETLLAGTHETRVARDGPAQFRCGLLPAARAFALGGLGRHRAALSAAAKLTPIQYRHQEESRQGRDPPSRRPRGRNGLPPYQDPGGSRARPVKPGQLWDPRPVEDQLGYLRPEGATLFPPASPPPHQPGCHGHLDVRNCPHWSMEAVGRCPGRLCNISYHSPVKTESPRR